MSRLLLALVLAALLACPLAACGRKGDPFVPKGEANTLKQKYPASYPDQGDQAAAGAAVESNAAPDGKTQSDKTRNEKKVQ